MKEIKVVFHIDEMHKWNLVLANAKNLIDGLRQETLTVEIVANSEAVKYFLVSDHEHRQTDLIEALLHEKVLFCVCNNSLKSLKILPEDLVDYVSIVPSGVVEIALRQYEGYAYLKP